MIQTDSEILYEAACRTSDVRRDNYYDMMNPYTYSCHAVAKVESDSLSGEGKTLRAYQVLMTPGDAKYLLVGHVEDAAASVEWRPQDYRTFMLLMASEACK